MKLEHSTLRTVYIAVVLILAVICRSLAIIVTIAPTGRLPCQTSKCSGIFVEFINC